MKKTWIKPQWEKISEEYSCPTIIKDKVLIPFLLSKELESYYTDKNVLDAGCGPGHIAKSILEKFNVKSYTGIDNSKSFVEYASNLEINSLVKPVFSVGDSRKLAFDDPSLDTVLSINVVPIMSNIDDLTNLISESRRVLKKSGVLLLMTTNDKTFLSKKFNENFQVELLDTKSVPMKCKLKVKKTDGAFIEFFDLCWPSNEIFKILEKQAFKVSYVKGLGGGEFFNQYEPFIFYKAVISS